MVKPPRTATSRMRSCDRLPLQTTCDRCTPAGTRRPLPDGVCASEQMLTPRNTAGGFSLRATIPDVKGHGDQELFYNVKLDQLFARSQTSGKFVPAERWDYTEHKSGVTLRDLGVGHGGRIDVGIA